MLSRSPDLTQKDRFRGRFLISILKLVTVIKRKYTKFDVLFWAPRSPSNHHKIKQIQYYIFPQDHFWDRFWDRFVRFSSKIVRAVGPFWILEQLLDTALPTSGRLFPHLSVDKVVKRYAYLRSMHRELHGTVFHSTRKWFITQCERTGVPEHFTATLVGHHSARSANKLTYGLYSAGISGAQKRQIVEGVRVPEG